jgi:hypothetical protein
MDIAEYTDPECSCWNRKAQPRGQIEMRLSGTQVALLVAVSVSHTMSIHRLCQSLVDSACPLSQILCDFVVTWIVKTILLTQLKHFCLFMQSNTENALLEFLRDINVFVSSFNNLFHTRRVNCPVLLRPYSC